MYRFQEVVRSVIGALRFEPEDEFFNTGRFSIKDFLEAGDSLVNLGIGWEWMCAKKNIVIDYLPLEKHYLSKNNIKPIKFHEQPVLYYKFRTI